MNLSWGNSRRSIARSLSAIFVISLVQTIAAPIVVPESFAPRAEAVNLNQLPTGLGTVYQYLADSYTTGASTWSEARGQNSITVADSVSLTRAQKVVNTAGTLGAAKAVTAVRGQYSTTLTFPTAVAYGNATNPADYTFIFVARYAPQNATGADPYYCDTPGNHATADAGRKSRIFSSVSGNWLSGFWACSAGAAYHEGWMTPSATAAASMQGANGNNWLLGSDCGYTAASSSTCKGRFRALGVDVTTTQSTNTTGHQVIVNGGAFPLELSDFEIAEVISYPTILQISDVILIENYLAGKYGLSLGSTTASKLDIFRNSEGSILGRAFTTQPQIAIENSSGQLITSDNSTIITASISNPSGSIVGTATATAVRGIATFSDLGLQGFSGNNYTITYTANTGYTSTSETRLFISAGQSETDTALSFNGSTQYAKVNDSSEVDFSSNFTFQAWVRPTAVDGLRMILNKEDSVEFYISGGKYGFSAQDGINQWSYQVNNVVAVANEWHHVAYTKDSSSTNYKFYLDGQLAYEGDANALEANTPYNSPYPLTIAGRSGSASGTAFDPSFAGEIDHLAVYSVVRTQSQIQSDMHSHAIAGNSSLQYYFDFNEGSGTTLYNRKTSATSATDLTIIGSPTWSDVKTVDTTTLPAYTIVKFPRTYLTSIGGWKAPSRNIRASIVTVAGGGGGGSRHGGGGGGGGVAWSPNYALSMNAIYAVSVGVGGVGYGQPGNNAYVDGSGIFATSAGGTPSGVGTNGGNSYFLPTNQSESITALGGGGGGGSSLSGGSSGGTNSVDYATVAAATQYSTSYFTGYGNIGGRGYNGTLCGTDWCGGGGGGAGAVGGTPTISGTTQAGNGGAGKGFYIDAATQSYFGGGGGGGSYTASIASTGGTGGGGAGGKNDQGSTGTYSTGGGGGGGGFAGATSYRGGNGGTGVIIIRWITASVPTFTQPANAYLNVGMTETFTLNVSQDSATVNLTRTFRWESTTGGSGGTYSLIKQGTGAANASFSWVPTDTSTSGSNYLYRVIVTDSDTAGLFIVDTSTAVYAVINRALSVSGTSGIAKTINVAKSETFTITLGTSSYRTTLTSNNPGITLDTSTATSPVVRISDTITVGTYYETLTVTDSVSASIVTPLTIVVAAPPNLLNTGEIVSDGLLFNMDVGNSSSVFGESGTAISVPAKDISGGQTNPLTSGTYEGQSCAAPTYSSDFGGNLIFDGTSQCLYVPYLGTNLNKNFSVETWVMFPSTGFQQGSAVITQNNKTTVTYSDMSFTLGALAGSNVNMRFGYRKGAATDTWAYSGTIATTPANVWKHILGTYDGGSLKLYIDGQLQDSITTTSGLTGGATYGNTSGYFIGVGFTDNKWFKGSIASARIYKVALSDTQVGQNYNATKDRFQAANSAIVNPSQKYGTTSSESFTATSGYGARTISYALGNIPGLSYTTSGNVTTLRMGESLTATTHAETITVTDSLGASTYLPIKLTVSKADTLTIAMDTATTVVYNASPITVYPKIYFKGLAGVDTLTASTRFTSATYTESATVPTDVDTYTVIAANPIFSVGALSNYVNVVYETSTAKVTQANQNKLSINLYGAIAGTPFLIQTSGGSGDGLVTESVTAGSTATGCAVSNHVLSNTSPSTQQLTCNILVTKAASKNYKVETLTATVYFMLFVNNMPTNQVGSGSTIGLNGINSVWVDPGATPTITGPLSGTFTQNGSITITGSGFSLGPITVKFNRVLLGTNIVVGSDTSMTVTIPATASTGTFSVTNRNGSEVSSFAITIG